LSGYVTHNLALAAGASYQATTTFVTATTTAPGSYTLFVKVDGIFLVGNNTDNGYVTEANEANNKQALSITQPTKPDLTLTNGSILSGLNTSTGVVGEANEANNTQALSITLPTRPDLTITLGSVGTIVRNGNGSYSIPVTWTVTNIGASTAQSYWYDVGYLSS